MRITGNTRVFLILGDPVAQVRAPEVFNHLFEQHGIDAVLVPAQVTPADFAAFARTALKARNIAGYGEFMILSNLSLKAKRGKITLLLGPNGAGKSTVLKTLFGMLKVRQGRIRLDGQDITGASAKDLLVQHGVAFVPQGRNLFGQLTAYENLELGGITLGMKTTRERIPEVLERFPRIKERLNSAASSLSGGEQKQLEVGRALLLRPKVILIDEPSIGLSPMVVQDVFKLLRQLANQGTTVLMVEQNVKSALKMADEAIALESGRLVLHKAAEELLGDPNIERLFLGGAHAAAAPTP